MIYRLNMYSVEEPTPRQFDVIQGLLRAYERRKGIKIKVFGNGEYSRHQNILVLGSVGADDHDPGLQQFTYSARQFETRANAQTVFDAALDNYYGFVHGLPEEITILSFWNASFFKRGIAEHFDLTQPIAIDVETGGVLGETVTPRTAPLLTIAFAQNGYALVLKVAESVVGSEPDRVADNITFLQWLLPQIEKPIWHNGKFDIAVIEANTGVRMPNWFDTMLAHHALNQAAREHGLKPLCKRYFNAWDWEAGINKWIKGNVKDYSVIPRDMLADYNGYDVLWTYRLWQKLQVEIDADDRAQMALYLEMKAADFLQDVEAAGIPVAEAEVDRLLVGYAQEAGAAYAELSIIVGGEGFNPGSPQQVKAWLHSQGIETSTTNEEFIENLKVDTWDPIVKAFCSHLIAYRKAKKMQNTYLRAWWKASQIEKDSRVHPTFNVHGTTTGRLSSSNPNAQNVPRDKTIRKMVTLDGTNELV